MEREKLSAACFQLKAQHLYCRTCLSPRHRKRKRYGPNGLKKDDELVDKVELAVQSEAGNESVVILGTF